MQVFILGKTKSGKSALSALLQGFAVYEAGAWARREFDALHPGPHDEFAPAFKEALTAHALGQLRRDPYHSVKQYEAWMAMQSNPNKAIVGVRNPDDFLHMLRGDTDNRVVHIDSSRAFTGSLELFEEGLVLIKNYLHWRAQLGNAVPTLRIHDTDIGQPGDTGATAKHNLTGFVAPSLERTAP